MNLIIRRTRDKGDIEKERVILYSESVIDIGKYILFDSTYMGENRISNKLRKALWLPDIEINAGDLVVVYTKHGLQKSKTNEDGSQTHFVYWGLDNPIWNREKACPCLARISTWDFKIEP
jgi:hypothetical protein